MARLARFWLGCVALWRARRQAREGQAGKPMASVRSRELQARLDSAIVDGEFCFHYQGKFDTAQLRLVGLEALLRWDHPRHGLIYPNAFIGLAEQTDAIVALGNWGIDAACRLPPAGAVARGGLAPGACRRECFGAPAVPAALA